MTQVSGRAGRDLYATVGTLAYEALYDILKGGAVPGLHELYTRVIPGFEGKKTLEAMVNGPPPALRRRTGARVHKRLRGYTHNVATLPYEATLDIPITDFDAYGAEGIRKRVSDLLSNAKGSGLTKLVHDFMHTASAATSPICYDGVVLFGTTHPHVASTAGTGTNTDTTAFSASQLNAVINTMQQYKSESGELLGIMPDVVRCGQKLAPLAKEVLEADLRVISVDAADLQSGTRIAAAAGTNVFKGTLDVVIDPRITTLGYYVHDTKAEKPVHLGFSRNFEVMQQTGPDSDSVYERDTFSFGVNVEMAMLAVGWQGIYWGDNDAS